MRFALLGNHPDGVALACALVESGRHHLAYYTAAVDESTRRRWGPDARKVGDVEEVLADPVVEAVLVAGDLSLRPAQLRRALQSERHVLCVYPPDSSPETAYEAAMIRDDTGCVLVPLMPEGLHPAVRRLADFVRRSDEGGPVGSFRLLEVERAATAEVLEGLEVPGQKGSVPGWDVLRALGGEVAEVSGFTAGEEPEPGEPVLLSGRFEAGGLFQVTLLPRRPAPRWRLAVIGSRGRAELVFPVGWEGPACLEWRDESGERREEYWERWDPWPTLIEAFEAAVADRTAGRLRWQDAQRALELDDAARRSIERRRSSLLEYPEASEEVGFKGTMTLVGCAMLWAILLLLILSHWLPRIGWLIVPLIVLFLILQFLRYLIPPREERRR